MSLLVWPSGVENEGEGAGLGDGILKQFEGSDAFQRGMEVADMEDSSILHVIHSSSAGMEEEITVKSTSPAAKSAADRRYFLRFRKNHARL